MIVAFALLPLANEAGKVIFSQACVIPSVHGWGCSWQRGACVAGGMHGGGGAWRGGGRVRGRRDDHCIGRYASYWNALFSSFFLFLIRNLL